MTPNDNLSDLIAAYNAEMLRYYRRGHKDDPSTSPASVSAPMPKQPTQSELPSFSQESPNTAVAETADTTVTKMPPLDRLDPQTPLASLGVTVHLGAPFEKAENVTVPFAEYIKNIASGEIHPAWTEDTLRDSIRMQISFTLDRLYSGFYREQGHDFDVTASAVYDQSYVPSRKIFPSIGFIVDDLLRDDADD